MKPLLLATVILALLLCQQQVLAAPRNATLRGNYDNCRLRFSDEKLGHVAFLGGSITEMDGYRPLVSAWLSKQFPKTKFTFTNAGISSTCSTTGAMRLQRDVLSKGPVDLFFVEFAVNDTGDAGHGLREAMRGLEGIIRQLRRHNPQADIVVTHFVSPGMRDQIQAGQTPLAIAAHENVAEYYEVSTINLAREVATRITAGTFTWEQFGGTHPGPEGNRLCAEMIAGLFQEAWGSSLLKQTTAKPHAAPTPLDDGAYAKGRFLDPKLGQIVRGWELQAPHWERLPGSKLARFSKETLLCGEQPGAELTLPFDGRAVGAYLLAGPDAGVLEASVDGAAFQTIDTYHHYSQGLHYPRTVMFATDLAQGHHTLTLRIADETQSSGHAIRIMQFVAN